jgi:tRNA nucleotidyltransferase (CCA-adding enzyme)
MSEEVEMMQKAVRDYGLPAAVEPLFTAARQSGGRALLVGGCVRDMLLGIPVKDIDVEVYGLESESLRSLLLNLGSVNLVGQSFAVFKFKPRRNRSMEIDVSLPRLDRKTGAGHRGFSISYDPSLSFEEASRRRDLTVNAILYDPLTEEFIDPHGGVRDIRLRLLRAVDPDTFIEDSLRVLRVAQLAARLEFKVDSDTIELCRSLDLSDLPADRIREEMFKLLKAARPSTGLRLMDQMRVTDQLFPELAALKERFIDDENLFAHTERSIDVAASISSDLTAEKKITVMIAALAHELAIEQVERFLDHLGLHTLNGYEVRKQTVALVENHLKPQQFYESCVRSENPSRLAFARVAEKCDPRLLARVALSHLRAMNEDEVPVDYFRARISEYGFEAGLPEPLLLGRHILEEGIVKSPGPAIGRILKAVYERQLDGEIVSFEEALSLARQIADEKKTADEGR